MDDAMVREISITRIFAAPRDLVWRAWTEAEQLAQWFMPHGFTVPECDMDLRPGGKFTMTVRAPDGTLTVLRVLSDTQPVGTQGPVWYVEGKVV